MESEFRGTKDRPAIAFKIWRLNFPKMNSAFRRGELLTFPALQPEGQGQQETNAIHWT